MDCLESCELYGYNCVHNGGDCYLGASHCERRIQATPVDFEDDLTFLDVPEDPEEDDDAIEDPSLP